MKISLNWVRQFCPFQSRESPREIGVRFSLATAEVEGVEVRGAGLDRVVAARVLAVRPHPQGEQLQLARIEVGKAPGSSGSTGGGSSSSGGSGSSAGGTVEQREVVCGAPNVRPGVYAPYAPPGAIVGGREIRVASIRGVDSPGMLLSEAELGLSDVSGKLWELPAEASPGTPLSQLFPEAMDVVLEVDNKSLTHRPDLWGHYGIAREFSVIYGTQLRPYPAHEELAGQGGDGGIRVVIDPEPSAGARPRCARYCGLRIDGVRVRPSPDWLRHRLLAVGLRPINNVVDVTNFVMLELGQPLHAFDADRIRGGIIRVRRAGRGEILRLLDGSTAELTAEDLVIADGTGPVALAGVMGGEGSGIGDESSSVFLESASFDAVSVRRTSLRTARTDSSARFEKSLDPVNARSAILRAAAMILGLSPGSRVVGPLQDRGFTPPAPIVIDAEPQAITNRLGADIPVPRMKSILEGLGFKVEAGAFPPRSPRGDEAFPPRSPRGDAGAFPPRSPPGEEVAGKTAGKNGAWKVTVPSWRATKDISIFEDLVEEVGRVHGYGQIAPFAPQWPVAAAPINERRRLERRAKAFLTLHGGLVEVFTYSMVGAAHCRAFGLEPDDHLKLRNAMSEELDRMRREIIPIHLEKVRDNQRFFDDLGIFEIGRVYLKDRGRLLEKELPRENYRIAGVLAFEKKSEEHFYKVRDLVLSLASHLGARQPAVAPLEADRAWIHPHVGARLLEGERDLGRFYRVHPEVEARLELSGEVLAFDLDFDAFADLPAPEERYRRLPRFPFVTFDVAVETPERTPAAAIESVIRKGAGTALRALRPFDVYRGPNLPPGTKSIAFQVAVGAEDHTLATSEADGYREAVIQALNAAGFKLRA